MSADKRLSGGTDRMSQLAWYQRARKAMATIMLGTALAQPALQGCSDTTTDRPHTPDAGQLPEIEDPQTDDDAAVNRAPDNTVDEEVNILDLDPETGMGATIRSIAQALRMPPQTGNIPVMFFNTTNGWKPCAQINMPEAQAGNQQWWDTTRSNLDPAQCGTVDVARQLPLGMPWRAENMFAQIRHTARLPMRANERINRRTQMRRAFLEASRQTELYQYLNNYSPDLAEQFVNLVCDGIPAVETEYGKEIHRSTTGAEGMWQIQPETLVDAHRLNPSAWQALFGRRRANVLNVTDATKVAALVFNNIFRYYRSHWNDNHAVFRYPEALLMPALIGAYNHGQGTVERMLNQRLQDQDLQAILSSGDADRIQNEAYITASTGYYLSQTNPNYGTASVGYVPKVYAYHALFREDVPGEDREIIDAHELPQIAQARTIARTNLTNLRRRPRRVIAQVSDSHFNLNTVHIPRNSADYSFVTSDSSQNNAVVYPWVIAHDPFARRYRAGLNTAQSLQQMIAEEVGNGNLLRENTIRNPEIVFDPHNISETWRRVMRRAHVASFHKLIVEINARMYAYGLPENVIVVPIITSTLRDTHTQARLRGHSNRSAHPMGSAIDSSCRQYAVIRRREDGNYERFVTEANIGMFFRALVQSSAHLARRRTSQDGGVQQGDIFVRFHGPPQHFHMVVRTLDTDTENDTETPTVPVNHPRPNTQANNRPNVPTGLRRPRFPNGRRRPQLRRPRFRQRLRQRAPELRQFPARRRPILHPQHAPVRRHPPLRRRIINRRGRR